MTAPLQSNPASVTAGQVCDGLWRDYLHERLGFIRMGAEICQRQIETGDDVGLRYQMKILVSHTKDAAGSFNAEQARRDAMARDDDGGSNG